jgi:hypothetical protein
MKYQLVVQWPIDSIVDYDAMIEVEDTLIEHLTEAHEVDGHDIGAGEMNLFVLTNDFRKAFGEVKALLREENLWTDIRVAYREIEKNQYIVLWPQNLKGFSVA